MFAYKNYIALSKKYLNEFFFYLKAKKIFNKYIRASIAACIIIMMLLYITFFSQLEKYFSLHHFFQIATDKKNVIANTILFSIIMSEMFILMYFKLLNNNFRHYFPGFLAVIILNLSSNENDFLYLDSLHLFIVTLYVAIFYKMLAIKSTEEKFINHSVKQYKGVNP